MPNKQKLESLTKYSNQTKNTRLALDIGTNSIGWALYKLDKNKKPFSILKTGVRIFSSGRNDKDYSTLNATRRVKRLQRRQRDRLAGLCFISIKEEALKAIENQAKIKNTALLKNL